MSNQSIQIPAGLFCVTTYGSITQQTTQAIWDLRSHSEKLGLQNVGWSMVPSTLVEKARNDAARTMLGMFQGQAQWLCFCDGDMVPPVDALHRMLMTAYGTHPWVDVLGAYCNLRGELALPTLDCGDGTWQSHFPGRGVLEVIRTGAAFLLCKRHVFERIPQPWFRTRAGERQLDVLLEMDNFSRIKFSGKNPFLNLPGRPWETLERHASADPSSQPGAFIPAEVGEDSGFCDRVRRAGLRIAVDTNIEIGHLDTVVVNAATHKKAMDANRQQWLQAVGVVGG
jgi:hypothetical protein